MLVTRFFLILFISVHLSIGTPIGEDLVKVKNEEIINDFTTTFPVSYFDQPSDDSVDEADDSFKYPVTPYPDPDSPTVPPEPENVDEETGEHKVVNGPIILGNKSCQCGTSIKTKIVGGEEVPITELPWTVALVRKRNTTQKGPYCGGTLINSRFIVTASHCVDGFDAKKIEVWLNEQDFRVEDENLNGTRRIDVEEIIMHPDYDRKKIDNDIALLKLAETVDIEGIFRPVCIPADESETYDNEQAIVAGWGAKEQGGSVSATLQKVTVPIISNKACNWRTLYLGRITDNQLCAGDVSQGGKDSCQGDSGGPLVVNRGDASQKLLVGVVSYGYGCARPFAPGVYTRVSRYPKWIVQNSKDADYCSS